MSSSEQYSEQEQQEQDSEEQMYGQVKHSELNATEYSVLSLEPSESDCFVVHLQQKTDSETHSFTRNLTEFNLLYLYLLRVLPGAVAPASPPKTKDGVLATAAILRFLRRIDAHPQLRLTQGFADFVHCQFAFVPASPKTIQRKTQSMFGFAKVPVVEVDVWFGTIQAELAAFQMQISAIGRVNDRIAISKMASRKHAADVVLNLNSWSKTQSLGRTLKQIAIIATIKESTLAQEVHAV